MPAARLKLVTVLACGELQLPPESVLYCQVAPLSKPLTLTAPLAEIPSLGLIPKSLSVSVGALGATVSTIVATRLEYETLPAASVT